MAILWLCPLLQPSQLVLPLLSTLWPSLARMGWQSLCCKSDTAWDGHLRSSSSCRHCVCAWMTYIWPLLKTHVTVPCAERRFPMCEYDDSRLNCVTHLHLCFFLFSGLYCLDYYNLNVSDTLWLTSWSLCMYFEHDILFSHQYYLKLFLHSIHFSNLLSS